MSHVTAVPLRRAAILLAPALCALALGACGGSGVAAGTPTSANDRDTARLKLQQCLREQGIDVPDPAQRGNGGGGLRGSGADREKVRAAMNGPCKKLRQAAFGNITAEQRQEFRDAFEKFAQCMRDNGVDVPDITQSGGPPRGLRGLDRDDPKVQAAREACQDELPRGGPGGAGPGGPPAR